MLQTNGKIKLILADDHQAIRRGLKDFFKNNDEIELLGVAVNGREALALLQQDQPDVVLTDIKMDVMDGRELCNMVQLHYPNVGVVAYTMFDDEAAIKDMRKAGACGFVLKSSHEDEIIKAIKAVYDGGEYYCSSIKSRINLLFESGHVGAAKEEKKQEYNDTELKIINLVCQEQSSKEIADSLGLSKRTVDHQKEKIQGKMGVKGVVGVAMYAIRNWLLYSVSLLIMI
ncbi:MAG TPA: response regulator transcription factor [Flavisolibacter sp.]|jgi:DNA-binding NarL/FixJ family response regulator|nr:response regulator transcription factor [Flavisolibacter sp.]